ncbi:hypothetical protein B0H63DRAFT_462835 [Podospora didyma]|uniref:Uncharacterized protein n=1 Tax=Podospora didyma TaxID=330526 RepID=A0AAE0P8B4_9PEZI|nr:hypothetical protein B0H63DRAFT_462835 [Podospora didyma]
MAPPTQLFSPKDLPLHVQIDQDGKLRKTKDRQRINLAKDCELLGLLQYDCNVFNPESRDGVVRCYPVQRWFRRCQDKKGSFTVETTAWEDTAAAAVVVTPAAATAAASAATSSPQVVNSVLSPEDKDSLRWKK